MAPPRTLRGAQCTTTPHILAVDAGKVARARAAPSRKRSHATKPLAHSQAAYQRQGPSGDGRNPSPPAQTREGKGERGEATGEAGRGEGDTHSAMSPIANALVSSGRGGGCGSGAPRCVARNCAKSARLGARRRIRGRRVVERGATEEHCEPG